MVTAIIMHCYVGIKSLWILFRVKLNWICNFVVDHEASHLPNIDNKPVPCTIMSVGSGLLHIMVNFSLCDEANILLLWVRGNQVTSSRKMIFLLQSNGIAIVGSNNLVPHFWCKCVDFKEDVCLHTPQSGKITLYLSNSSSFSLTLVSRYLS